MGLSLCQSKGLENLCVLGLGMLIVPAWMLVRGGTGAQSLVYSVGLKYAKAVREIQEENKAI